MSEQVRWPAWLAVVCPSGRGSEAVVRRHIVDVVSAAVFCLSSVGHVLQTRRSCLIRTLGECRSGRRRGEERRVEGWAGGG
jgi:hypothetical protein